ncbi:APG9-domain-containing protein [Hymenopellis radicata]|nr:APG9-domain-containing protein [Hymenopellis radicata]
MQGADPIRLAYWHWVNVSNLDAFLQDVYYYYEGKGIYSIALSRGLNLLTVGFVIGFSTFLLGCIDYSRIDPDKTMRLSDAIVDRCVTEFSGLTLLFFIPFTAFYIWQIVSFIMGIQRLRVLYNFYTHLLKIPDVDIQTISWPEIVRRIGAIREDNPNTALSSQNAGTPHDVTVAKLDAHDIANRILRQENYLIALFNKDLLDLRVPLPQILSRFISEEEGKGKMLTQALEWNLRFCLMEYLFDRNGQVRKVFLNSRNRVPLIEGLRRRFIFMGILNAIFAPFIVLYLLMYSFFRYFEEYHKNPSSIGGRRYTSYAQWKFREFNELPHLFVRRLDESYPAASMYIGQFPNEKVTLIMRDCSGPGYPCSFGDHAHRTVLFYLGVFGSILAVARGMVPDDNRVFDPELLMTESWRGELHSKKTHQEFGELFAMKILIFIEEVMSVVLTPFVLWFSLPDCALPSSISSASYFGAPTHVQDRRMISNEGKMEKSFLNFKAANPDWNPSDPSGSAYLNRMADFTAAHLPGTSIRRRVPVAPAGSESVHTAVGAEPIDRAQEYDRALRQSQFSARRRGTVGASSGVDIHRRPQYADGVCAIWGPSMAQTAVLGDSQGSVHVPLHRPPHPEVSTIAEDDLSEDGGVGSGLGGSYVDGAKRIRGIPVEDEQDGLEDGGVLGLLAQIYDRRDGPTRVI